MRSGKAVDERHRKIQVSVSGTVVGTPQFYESKRRVTRDSNVTRVGHEHKKAKERKHSGQAR